MSQSADPVATTTASEPTIEELQKALRDALAELDSVDSRLHEVAEAKIPEGGAMVLIWSNANQSFDRVRKAFHAILVAKGYVEEPKEIK